MLLIIAGWLAVKLVEHVGDLKRSERHVSMTADYHRDRRRYDDIWHALGVFRDLLIQMYMEIPARWTQNKTTRRG
jgi:hypothetical protein